MMCLNSRSSEKIASSTLFFVLTASLWEAFDLECITSIVICSPLVMLMDCSCIEMASGNGLLHLEFLLHQDINMLQ